MRTRAVGAVVAPLLWNNWLLPRFALNRRGRTAANVVAATGYALVVDAQPHWVSGRGLRVGIGCAAVVTVACAAALAIPPVRRAIAGIEDRGAEVGIAEWVAVHIPFGTVYTEELIFRAALDPLLDKEFGTRAGALLGSVAFGLWHIRPARVAGDDIAGTVAFTAASGLLFGALRRHTGSAAAPALLHWAVNTGGALLPRLASARVGSPEPRILATVEPS